MDYEQFSDEDLVGYIISEPDHYSILVGRYSAPLTRFVYTRFVADEDAAKDIVQEALMKAYLSLEKFDSKRKWKSWIYKITSNVACNYLRERRNIIFEKDFPEVFAFEASESRVVAEPEVKFLRALSKLDENYKEILNLYFFKSLTLKEIGERLNLPARLVRIRFLRAQQQFKICYLSEKES